jgi:hypothetical protein
MDFLNTKKRRRGWVVMKDKSMVVILAHVFFFATNKLTTF